MENVWFIFWGIVFIFIFVVGRIWYLLNPEEDNSLYRPCVYANKEKSFDYKSILFRKTSRLWQLTVFLSSGFVMYHFLDGVDEGLVSKLMISGIFALVAILVFEIIVRVSVVVLKGVHLFFKNIHKF